MESNALGRTRNSKMIEINLGNVGSGKTACVVRDMFLNVDKRQTFSNIITKKIKNNTLITKDMIIKEVPAISAAGKTITDKRVNKEFWEEAVKKYKSVNVIIDEAHTVFNARRGMTKHNIIMSDWLSLLRRVIGGTSEGYGKLILITQLKRRLDIIAREMSTKIRYHKCHYKKECNRCGAIHLENNETPEKVQRCMNCAYEHLTMHSHVVEVFVFENLEKYEQFELFNEKTYYDHYFTLDIVQYFPYYDTLQWDNLLSEG